MTPPAHFVAAIYESNSASRDRWPKIELTDELFADYVWAIVCRHLKDPINDAADTVEFTKRLYLPDLFLACACVLQDEEAWKTFDVRYRGFVTNLVRFFYRNGTDCEEIADLILVGLYFNDRSGRKRLASYDGRSSLSTWLRVIVLNRAINDRHQQKPVVDEMVADIPDNYAVTSIESAIKARRYSRMLRDSLEGALRQLSAAERLMLIWRYEDNMPLGEVAKLLGIHQANVTRRLIRLQNRLRDQVIDNLTRRHQLSPAAIQECFSDIVENPSVSLLGLLKQQSTRDAETLKPEALMRAPSWAPSGVVDCKG